MKELSREKAENLFNGNEVIKRKIEQSKHILKIYMELSNGIKCMVKYDKVKDKKTYYLI
jgi:hypothetical protein